MRLPKRLRHWLVFKLADYEFTTRSGWRNDENLYVIRQGCLVRLLDDVKLKKPDCGNSKCWQGKNAWHDADCYWEEGEQK